MMMMTMTIIMISYQQGLSNNAYLSLLLFLAQVGPSLILILSTGIFLLLPRPPQSVEALTLPVAFKQ